MVDNGFKTNIAHREYDSIRDALRNALLLDHNVTSGMFYEYFAECKKSGILDSLYQKSDERDISKEETEENLEKLVGQLATNFSFERLDAILRLAKIVWKSEQIPLSSSGTTSSSGSTSYGTSTSTSSSYSTANTSGSKGSGTSSGRVVGEERIISETPLYDDEEEEAGKRSRTTRPETEPKMGTVLAVAAVAAVAVIAGILIFG